MSDRYACVLALALVSGLAPMGLAQEAGPAQPAASPVKASSPDGIAVGDPDRPVESNHDRAWELLTTALADQKHSEVRIQGLAALGLMGSNARSLTMIEDAMSDPDVDLRTAAVLAAGQTRSPAVTTSLRQMLDDKEPQVAFAAATALWKMGDRSGEDILVAVVDGERRANATLMNGARHTMSNDLHHPSTLARLGAMQGAGMLLGPFGFGLTAIEYMRRNGGDSARVSAVEEIAQNHTAPIRATLVAALKDKDMAVRVAAAKALASFHEPEVAPALAADFEDAKNPVRLTAAASFLMSTGAVAAPLKTRQSGVRKAARKS